MNIEHFLYHYDAKHLCQQHFDQSITSQIMPRISWQFCSVFVQFLISLLLSVLMYVTIRTAWVSYYFQSFKSWQTQRQIRSRHSETSWLITTNSVKLVLQIAFGISLQGVKFIDYYDCCNIHFYFIGKLGALRASVLWTVQKSTWRWIRGSPLGSRNSKWSRMRMQWQL